MKSRNKPIADVEIGHRSTTTANLGNIAFRSKERIEWNSEEEKAANSEAANQLVKGRHREPWTL
jgi:hypothetical protein